MRALFVSWPCSLDPSNPAAIGLRTLSHWLADAGHEVTALSGGTLGGPIDFTEELRRVGVTGAGRFRPGSRSLVMYSDRKVKGNLICTVTDGASVEATDIRTFVSHGQRLIRDFRPHLLVYAGGERGVAEVVRLGRNGSCRILATAWEFGWENRETFMHAHQVVSISKFLARHYKDRIGLNSLGFPPPISGVEKAPLGKTVLVTQTRPEFGLPAVLAMLSNGERVRVEGWKHEWPDADGADFIAPSTDRGGAYEDVGAVLSISVDASGLAGAESVLRGIPIVADSNSPIEETSGGYGRFLSDPAQNGEAWAAAVRETMINPPDREEATKIALKLYAPEVQRQAYVSLFERVQAASLLTA
ncbi:MAG: hypothetical protein JNK63_02580 [Chthonomonas sp.]|nr:hypothetical protein [Chthonomonas sp.]